MTHLTPSQRIVHAAVSRGLATGLAPVEPEHSLSGGGMSNAGAGHAAASRSRNGSGNPFDPEPAWSERLTNWCERTFRVFPEITAVLAVLALLCMAGRWAASLVWGAIP